MNMIAFAVKFPQMATPTSTHIADPSFDVVQHGLRKRFSAILGDKNQMIVQAIYAVKKSPYAFLFC